MNLFVIVKRIQNIEYMIRIYVYLTSKECDSNFQISPKYYKVEYFSNWNNKQIYTSKQKYIFFQGINNLTGGCDKN